MLTFKLNILAVHGDLEPHPDPEIIRECSVLLVLEGNDSRVQLQITDWEAAKQLLGKQPGDEITLTIA